MSKQNKLLREEYKKTLNKFKYINKMSPFNLIDSEHINTLNTKLKNDNISYDAEPVNCCSHCKSLYLITDDDDNTKCVVCHNSINEYETHKNIYEYLKLYRDESE
jgi:uncharacterized paraquat-inducible protein A